MAFPFLTRALVDSGIQYSDMEVIITVLVGQLLLFIAIEVSDITRRWLLRHIGVRISLSIILEFFKVVLQKPLDFFNISEQGKTIQQFNDNLRVEAFLTTDTSQFTDSALKLSIFGVLLFFFNVTIGWILVLSTLLIAFIVFIFLRAREVIDNSRFEMSSGIRAEIVDIYTGIVDLKSNNQEQKRLDNWDKIQSAYSNIRLNRLRMALTIDGSANVVAQMRDILILFFAAKATIEGTMTLGTLLAIQYVLGQLKDPIDKIAQFLPKWQDTRLSLRRINEIIDIEDDERYEQHLPMPKGEDIRIENLSFAYQPNVPVLENINMRLPLGQKVALIGESGSGKSTLMKLIVGLMPYQEGQIMAGNTQVNKINLNDWLSGCSIILQDSVLFNRSLWYNITFEEKITPELTSRVYKCLDLCLIRDVVDRHPKGLHAIPGKDVILSKGQVQRLLLTRAIFKSSDYILLDEPFSALDGPTYRKILSNIKSILDNKTLIIVTHKLGVAQAMDHIYLIHNGKIHEHGSHEQLVTKGAKYLDLIQQEEVNI